MAEILKYLLEVSVLTSVFYLFYRYLYFKLAYFVWSRYYFYAFLILSLIIPFLPGIVDIGNLSGRGGIFEIYGGNPVFYTDSGTNVFDNTSGFVDISVRVLFAVWASVAAGKLLIPGKQIYSIFKTIKNGEKTKYNDIILVKADFKGSVYSFFNYVFINDEFEKATDEDKRRILKHEEIHAKQMHSADNIIFEIFAAIFWFNPVSSYIRADLKLIHEFITDNVLTGNKNIPEYSKLILKTAIKGQSLPAVNNFSTEEIKNRIKLISFPENQKIRKRRFIISLPVLALTVFALWLVVSTLNSYFADKPESLKIYTKPFSEGSYKIISPFFENKKIKKISVSHREVSYELKNYSDIYSVSDGTIMKTEKKDIFGLTEYDIKQKLNDGNEIIYKGLYKIYVSEGDKIKKGEKIGLSGDVGLYPKTDIRLIKNGKPVNPEKYY